ncbi:hypothetical protein [Micromonospora sp. NPDC049274]|uniref:hypothetical protein n=1 Tax=Micromonospora sp. NPDC049274 TaxID=3154829 RepID=UPI003419A155
MSGEQMHAKGADGARRAKIYLEATTRANVYWVNPADRAVPKLTFPWLSGGNFSFDMGGVLLGGDLEGQEFLAESKNYASAQDQGTHYLKFVAQCYRAFTLRPERCDNFVWIAWSPFLVTRWDELQTPAFVREGVLEHRGRVLGEADPDRARELVDDDTTKAVADRLRMMFLSSWHEKLTPLRPDLFNLLNFERGL